MFNLTLVARETGGKLNYENCAFVCSHRNEINALAQNSGISMMHNNTLLFETEEEMFQFASKIEALK